MTPMRALILAAFAAPLVAAPALAMDMPARKPGLWEMKMLIEGTPGQTMQQCIDAATDKEMRAFSSGINADMGNACEQQSFEKTATGYTFESACTGGARKTVSRGTVTGDFDSAYTIDVTTSGGVSPGETKMQLAATWLGPCKTGQKPGDIVMPGGMTINIRQMQKLRGMMPGRPPGQ